MAKKAETTEKTQEVIVDEKVSFKEKLGNSKPVNFVKRHADAFKVGAGAILGATLLGAGYAAYKAHLEDSEVFLDDLDHTDLSAEDHDELAAEFAEGNLG